MLSHCAQVAVLCLCLAGTAALAADQPSEDLQKIALQTVARYEAAFAKRDAAALAALFTSAAEYVDVEGTVFHGRAAIEEEYASSFAENSPGVLAIEVLSLRPVAAGVLVEEGVSTFTPKQGKVSGRMRYTATHVRQAEGAWLLASVRELEKISPTPHEQLQALSWLLGRWREESAGTVVSTEWKWSPDGNFLLAEYSARIENRPAFSGTQRVGWDGDRKQLRMWVFDSQGGFSQGWWTPRDKGAWSVQLSGVTATGERNSSLLTYTPAGPDVIRVSLEQRMRGGESIPDFSQRVVRQPPEPAVVLPKR